MFGNYTEALRRELAEEAGVGHIEIYDKIGKIKEMREQMQLKSIHYCFLVKLTGHLEKSSQTDNFEASKRARFT